MTTCLQHRFDWEKRERMEGNYKREKKENG